MVKAVIYINTNMWHFSQIVTGYLLLKKQEIVDLEIKYEEYRQWSNVLKVFIDGVPVVYDMSDNSAVDEEHYARVQVYFKRMCLKSDLANKSKLQPLGFNYPCYLKGWDFYKINNRLLPLLTKVSLQRFRYIPLLPNFLGLHDSIKSGDYTIFENDKIDRPFNIQYSTRLWSFDGVGDNTVFIEDRKKVNQGRIDLVKMLKNVFKDNYSGGIEGNFAAKQLAPDLIIPNKNYNKVNYVKTLKNSAVGIVTPGLEDSISWKFGEYIAAGLAIVCTPDFLKYAVPGNFLPGKNFLVYRTLEECEANIAHLKENHNELVAMMSANIKYYNENLKPDKLVLNTVKIALKSNSTTSYFSTKKIDV